MIRELIAQLEAASEGSRALDVEILIYLKPNRAPHPEGMRGFVIPTDEPYDCPISAPYYTSSLDAALTLVPEGKEWTIGRYQEGRTWFEACIGKPGAVENEVVVEANTSPLAVCIAALKARVA
jgi:hypothetical protein